MMNLKESMFNSWEWNIPMKELRGYIYVADNEEDDDLIIISELEMSDGRIIDVRIIGISDDFETVTVSTATNLSWGEHVCFSHDNIREAYLHYLTGKAA